MTLFAIALLTATPIAGGEPEVPRHGIRDSVCALKAPAVPGDQFSLLALPAIDRPNESGVLILVNCSSRKIVSIRDPSPPGRRNTEYVYDPSIVRGLRGDPGRYEFINFNERAANSIAEVNGYSRETYWRGRCRFDGLELTTVDPADIRDRKTITFSLNICKNHVLALVTP